MIVDCGHIARRVDGVRKLYGYVRVHVEIAHERGAGLVEQGGRRLEAAAHGDGIAVELALVAGHSVRPHLGDNPSDDGPRSLGPNHGMVGENQHSPGPEGCCSVEIATELRSRVGDGDYSHSRIEHVEGRIVCLVVGRDNERGVAGLDSIKIDETPDSGAEHDAGKVVALERKGHLLRPGRDDHMAGAQVDDAVWGPDAEQVALVVAEDRGVGENVDALVLSDASGEHVSRFGCGHFSAIVDIHELVSGAVSEPASESRLVVHEGDPSGVAGRLQCRRHARDASSHDGNVGVGIRAMLGPMSLGIEIDAAQSCESSYEGSREVP